MAANEGTPKHLSENRGSKEHLISASVATNEDELFFSPVNKDWQEMLQEAEGEENAVNADILENTALVQEELLDVNGDEYPADQIADSVLSPADYYDLLGLSTSATTAEIVAAYRHRAREVADLSTSDPLYVNIKKV